MLGCPGCNELIEEQYNTERMHELVCKRNILTVLKMGEGVYHWLTLVISVNIVFVGPAPVQICDKPADIAFLIDSSSSIWIYDFEKQIKFVQELVKRFNIGPDTIQVAALTFSHNVVNEFHFNDVDSAQEASDRIGRIVHESGNYTFTHYALDIMRTDIFSPSNGARAGVAKICILLTDGQSSYPMETLEKAGLAKAAGITILAIGIGDTVDEQELRTVVSPPADQNYFHSSTFDRLKEKRFPELIGQIACDEPEDQPPAEVCQGKNADILFVVDMSSSIRVKHFKEVLELLADLVRYFDTNSGKTRVGMVTFSTATEVQFYLDKYRSKEDIREAILSTQSHGGLTNTHLALQRARYEMFSMKHGSRRGVDHICIVITDGASQHTEMTIIESNSIHKAGIVVFAISVGHDVDVEELHHIASKPEYVFEVNGYGALNITNILANKTCKEPEDQPPAEDCRGKREDVVFIVDMSNSIWVVYFQEQLKFLSDLVGFFDINDDNARVGLLTFSTDTRVHFYLNTYNVQDEISKAILAIKSEGGLTNTHLALQKALYEMMTPMHGSRSDVDHVIIVFTDGLSRVPRLTARQAHKIHQAGVEVIAVGVGDRKNKAELEKIASRKEFVFEVSGYNTLQEIKHILARKTCEVTSG
ncbi:cartilage matrix protein-like isoform X2 [Mercenaria mercenaria]|uniref:cartilage matrix protein-like isoform X2 n=1 Tax=Mercenaria mercenaria TaxID=6596 RepID=UPI00234FA35A|nr:cartilage matrix protein-like isoform X2 [Mercenaria mercenaria]